MAGFPKAIARAQRDEMQKDLVEAKRLVNTTVENLRDVGPHNVALSRGEYDRLVDYLVGAQASISLGLDQIDGARISEDREDSSE